MPSYIVCRILGLTEGLIYTETPQTTIKLLNQWSPRIATYGGTLQVDFSNLSKSQAEDLLRDLDRFGWFPAMISDDEEQQAFEATTFKALLDAGVSFVLKLEARYDPVVQQLPEHLWHVSPSEKRNKIEKLGLTPKSQGKLSPHPDRIYLARTRAAAEALAHEMAARYRVPAYSLFQVDVNKPNFQNAFGQRRYMVDPNQPESAVYTCSNIPPGQVRFVATIDTRATALGQPRPVIDNPPLP